eukprot:sb/3475574/
MELWLLELRLVIARVRGSPYGRANMRGATWRHSHLVRSPHMCVGITPGVYVTKGGTCPRLVIKTKRTTPTNSLFPGQPPTARFTLTDMSSFSPASLCPSSSSLVDLLTISCTIAYRLVLQGGGGG